MGKPTFETVDPATGESLETYEGHSTEEALEAVGEADEASDSWSDRHVEERQSLLSDAADVLRDDADRYAETMTREMGKPISDARAEVEKCAWVCDYYAEHAAEHLQDERIGAEPGSRTYVRYEPLGVVLAIMPWNFPFWQVFRFAAPYLTAGNVGILKHASNVPGCALAIEEVFERSGYPEGVFTSVLTNVDAVEPMLEHDAVRAATLTGSNRAGSAVGETSGREIKKTVLELGGSDPFVVLDDANVEEAARVGAKARNVNSGQSCIAAKRFVVHDDIYDEFVEAFVEETESLKVGDPTDDDTQIGPQARGDLLEGLHEQVKESVEAGATVVTGGEPLDRDGHYYPPTVLTDVPDGCPAAEEELFGPVASVFRSENEEEAIERANDTQYGLGASVWTDDLERGERLTKRLEAGCVFVNEKVKSDPRLPFGGVKKSGYGRELGRDGVREFTNRKTVWIQEAGE